MPKAAAISHFNIVNNVIASVQHQNSIFPHVDNTMVVCNVLPLYHVFSFTGGSVAGCYIGGANIFPSTGFSAERAIKVRLVRTTQDIIPSCHIFFKLTKFTLEMGTVL